MDDGMDEAGDGPAAETVFDGLEVMAAYCAIDSPELRRAVKRIVVTLSRRTTAEAGISPVHGLVGAGHQPAPVLNGDEE